MKYQIDQSGKIEQTNKNTILCVSNGSWDTIIITNKMKRQLQEIFRRNGQIRNYVLFVFCACLVLLLKRNSQVKSVTIDREYYGKEAIIKKILLELLKKEKSTTDIYFDNIGRKVNAHKRAYLTFTGKLKAKGELKIVDICAEIKKTEVGKRLKDV